MMKHTPGPWHYSGDSLTHRQFDIYAPAQSPQQHICTVNNLSVERLYTRDPSNALANAQLIAAAPDLLEALQSLVDAYQTHFDVMPVAWQTFDNIARAAIEKATGG